MLISSAQSANNCANKVNVFSKVDMVSGITQSASNTNTFCRVGMVRGVTQCANNANVVSTVTIVSFMVCVCVCVCVWIKHVSNTQLIIGTSPFPEPDL